MEPKKWWINQKQPIWIQCRMRLMFSLMFRPDQFGSVSDFRFDQFVLFIDQHPATLGVPAQQRKGSTIWTNRNLFSVG